MSEADVRCEWRLQSTTRRWSPAVRCHGGRDVARGPGAGGRRIRGVRGSRVQPEGGTGELGGDRVPQAGAAQHRVIAVAHLDGRHRGDLTGALDEGPGFGRAGDGVGGPVREQHPPPGELAGRLAQRAARAPARRRPTPPDGRRPGWRRARPWSARSARPGRRRRPAAMPSSSSCRSADRGGLSAVPAAEPEPRPQHHRAAPAQRVPHRRRDRDHPEHGGLQRVGRFGARRLAAVRDHDHAGHGLGPGIAPRGSVPPLVICPPAAPARRGAGPWPGQALALARLTAMGHTAGVEAPR